MASTLEAVHTSRSDVASGAEEERAAIEWSLVRHILSRECSDALRNRWFVFYTLVFTAVAVGLAWVGSSRAAKYGVSVFGRTAASLVNLVMLVVPLMGLTLGALSIAQARDRGSLLYLLAQPVTRAEVILGKFGGLATAMSGAILVGFGASGGVIAAIVGGAEVGSYLAVVGLSVMVALLTIGIGLWLSAPAQRASVGVGTSIFVWLTLTILGDLGLMGSVLVLNMGPGVILALALINPLHCFKIAGLWVIRGDLDQLGPAGQLAVDLLGDMLVPVLVGLLLVWTVGALAGAYITFRRDGGV